MNDAWDKSLESRNIQSQNVSCGSDDLSFLPQMRTDVSLESKDRIILIDASRGSFLSVSRCSCSRFFGFSEIVRSNHP